MSKGSGIGGLAVAGIIAAVVVAFGVFGFVQYANTVAYGTRTEAGIEATWQNNTNILGTYTTKISEMAQVPSMARNDLTKVLKAAFGDQGRAGSQAAVQFVREAYPGTMDATLYRRLQETMEAGRNEFRDNQTKLIDQKRDYEVSLGTVWTGGWLKMAGFPRKDMTKFNIVTSSSAQESFRTGVDNGVKLPGADN
jgi:Tfp pilus assembly protein PilV